MGYNAMLVDDEPYARLWLRNCVNWSEYSFDVVSEAQNGEEALLMLETAHPDLIITDIQMPKLNGLDLMERAKEVYPEIEFVVVSGYSDYEYLRGAVKNGALDYLLKPVKSEDLRSLLEKTRVALGEKRDTIAARQKIYRENNDLRSEQNIMKLFFDLGWKRSPDAHGTDLNYYCVSVLHDIPFENARVLSGESARSTNVACESAIIGMEFICLLADNRIDALVDCLRDMAKRSTESGGVVSAGALKRDVSLLFDSYLEAHFAVNESIFFVENGLYQYKLLENKAKKQRFASASIELQKNVDRNDFAGAANAIDAFFPDEAKEGAFYFQDCAAGICRRLYNQEPGKKEFQKLSVARQIEILSEIGRTKDPTDLKHILKNILRDLFKDCGEDINDPVELARKYILDNYSKDISLGDIAESVNMSPNYLCVMFKQEMGKSVFDYVAETRISVARQLLMRSENKIYDVAAAAGFSDAKYFSRVFRRMTGLAPTEYRRKMLI